MIKSIIPDIETINNLIYVILVKNDDDSYTIFLNAKLTRENHLKSYAHAIRHIENGDFDKEDVGEIEKEAHNFKNT